MLSCGGHIGVNLPLARAARDRTLRLLRIRLGAPPRSRMFVRPLGRRRLQSFTPPLALVLSAVVLSGTLGAWTALLVAGPGLAADVASAGPRVDVPSSSGPFPIAYRAATPEDPSALAEPDGTQRTRFGERTAGTESSRTTASVLERGEGTATGAGQEGRIGDESSPSEQGGASEPPGEPGPGVPVEKEEPSEEGPGDDGEPEAPPEEQPAPPEEPVPPAEEPTELKVTICHKAGSPNAKTLTVDADAVTEHLAHGDVIGACP